MLLYVFLCRSSPFVNATLDILFEWGLVPTCQVMRIWYIVESAGDTGTTGDRALSRKSLPIAPRASLEVRTNFPLAYLKRKVSTHSSTSTSIRNQH